MLSSESFPVEDSTQLKGKKLTNVVFQLVVLCLLTFIDYLSFMCFDWFLYFPCGFKRFMGGC